MAENPNDDAEMAAADGAGTAGRSDASQRPHLRQYWFKPGQSGNPNGRPPKHPITDSLNEQCQKQLPDGVARAAGLPPDSTWADLLALTLMRKAAKGDLAAAREIIDRIEGRPRQQLEHSGPAGAPIGFAGEDFRAELARRLDRLREVNEENDAGASG